MEEYLVAGNYVIVLHREPGSEPPASYRLEVDASVEAVTRPDVAVGASAASLIGRQVYLPSGQTVMLNSKNARAVTGALTVANRGNWPDVLALRAGKGTDFFSVTYLGTTGNVTASLVAGTYQTPEIDENAEEIAVQVLIKPNVRKLVTKGKRGTTVLKKTLTLPVLLTSTNDPTKRDAASVKVQVK